MSDPIGFIKAHKFVTDNDLLVSLSLSAFYSESPLDFSLGNPNKNEEC